MYVLSPSLARQMFAGRIAELETLLHDDERAGSASAATERARLAGALSEAVRLREVLLTPAEVESSGRLKRPGAADTVTW